MLIAGFQKLTLQDYPRKVAAIVFTPGCVFRCPYCHNPELVLQKTKTALVAERAVLDYLCKKRSMLDGVVVTGGEPTAHRDLPHFLRRVKNLGLSVKLDTNGAMPDMTASCIAEGLVDYIAMDLKHTWANYGAIARAANKTYERNCRRAFAVIQNSGIAHEFRTTVLPGWHTARDIAEMAGYLRPGETYYLQQTRYEKTLEKDISRAHAFSLPDLAKKLARQFPALSIHVR